MVSQKAAEQGHCRAQVNLGYLYDSGKDIAQDYIKALYWYTKAAEKVVVIAQCNPGLIYYTHDGMHQNYKQAVYWFTKAEEQGDSQAQANLGCMYGRGMEFYKITPCFMYGHILQLYKAMRLEKTTGIIPLRK